MNIENLMMNHHIVGISLSHGSTDLMLNHHIVGISLSHDSRALDGESPYGGSQQVT
jgi:hypothetical protein